MMKKIPGLVGYLVSDEGFVLSTKYRLPRKLKPLNNGKGYAQVSLSYLNRQTKHYIHRLVAEAFIPNPENKQTVNHKNGDKRDNRVENLEWATHSENHHSSKPVLKINIGGDIVGEFNSLKEASSATGVDASSISRACRGKQRLAGKFKWRFSNAS